MNRAALLALTWGTVLAAVVSAMLLAASDDTDWREATTLLPSAPDGTPPSRSGPDERPAAPSR